MDRRIKLKDAHNQYREIFEQAKVAPVLLTEESHPSHVIMSAKTYQQLICKLAELEYLVLGQQAEAALSCSYLVGVDEFTFTSTLKQLAVSR